VRCAGDGCEKGGRFPDKHPPDTKSSLKEEENTPASTRLSGPKRQSAWVRERSASIPLTPTGCRMATKFNLTSAYFGKRSYSGDCLRRRGQTRASGGRSDRGQGRRGADRLHGPLRQGIPYRRSGFSERRAYPGAGQDLKDREPPDAPGGSPYLSEQEDRQRIRVLAETGDVVDLLDLAALRMAYRKRSTPMPPPKVSGNKGLPLASFMATVVRNGP